jgi:hypothetical protein
MTSSYPLLEVVNFFFGEFILFDFKVLLNFKIFGFFFFKEVLIIVGNKIEQKIAMLIKFFWSSLVVSEHEVTIADFEEVEIALEMG